MRSGGGRIGGRDGACWRELPGPRDPGADVGVPDSGRTGVVPGRIQRVAETGWRAVPDARTPMTRRRDRRPWPGDRDTVPVTMADEIGVGERGVMGAPRSRQTPAGPRRPESSVPDAGQGGRSRPVGSDRSDRRDQGGQAAPDARIIHTADVHLGARHDDLGEQAAAQRERQFAAFKAAVDLALAEKVDLFLDRRRPVRLERPAHAARSSASPPSSRGSPRRASGRCIIPGTHDVYDRSSIYRAYDLAGAGRQPARPTRWSPSSTPDHPSVHLAALDAVVHGRVLPDQARPAQPAARPRRASTTPRPPTWHIGLRPRLDRDPGQDRPRRGRHHDRGDRGERPRLPRARALALGAERARPGVAYAYAGAPEAVAARPGRAGKVLLVDARRQHAASGRRRASSSGSSARRASSAARSTPRPSRRQPALIAQPRQARPTRTSSSTSGWSASGPTTSTSTSTRSRGALRHRSCKVRVRDVSHAGADRGVAAVAGHDRGRVHPRPRGADRRPRGAADDVAPREAAELRDVLRLGRLLLAGHEVSL